MRQNEQDRLRRLAEKEHKKQQYNHWLTPESSPLKRLLVERYELACLVAKGRVVDAACGYGVGTYQLAGNPNVTSVIGFDLDQDAVDYAKIKFKDLSNISIVAGDLSDNIIPDCDWLVTMETVEHLPGPIEFLRFAKEKVRHGIVLSVPIYPTNNAHHCWTHFEPEEVDGWFPGWEKVIDERLKEVVGGKLVDRYKVAAYTRD